jgi:hypothetical protein
MRRAYLVVLPIVGAAFACQLLIGIDDRKLPDGGVVGGDGGPGDPCSTVGIPPTPDQSTSSGSDMRGGIFALYAVNTGTDAGAVNRPWGYNLDKTCTCPTALDSCAIKGKTPFCDREAGVDDEGQYVFTELQTAAASISPDAAAFFSDELFNNALQKGQSGLLLRVRGYNGKQDDAQVQVAIYSSPGFALDSGAPTWTGTDHWRVDQAYVSGVNAATDTPIYETNGWVNNFTLVASPAQIPIVIGSSAAQPVRLRLDTGYIVAKMTLNGMDPVSMTGTLAGRWKAVDFLQGLQGVPDPTDMSKYLCDETKSLTYLAVSKTVCGHRDLASNKDFDNTNAPCDAVSFGIGFEARKADFGNVEISPAPKQGCGAGWVATCP